MLFNTRYFIVVAVTVLMLTACGEDNAPSSAANKAPQEPAGKTVVAPPAETPPATTPAQESTETTTPSPASSAPNEPLPAEATPATTATEVMPQPEVLSHQVVYQEEIYKNWPYTSAPQPVTAETEVMPQPEVLSHQVVYQDEIYKNWPYTAAQPTTEPGPGESVEKKVESVVTSVEDKVVAATAGVAGQKVESVVSAVEEKVAATTAEVTGKTEQMAAGGVVQTHTINAEARVFNPDIVYVQPGDTVAWTNMTSHDSVSIDGLIPAGATPWQGQIGENLQVTLTVEGVYGYYCQPHIGFGMMGVIVVGKPKDLEAVKAYADKNMQGPFRRIIGKLNKVTAQ